jgi:fructose-1,6-bisphosphatase-3
LTLQQLTLLSKELSSKYTRSKVRKALPKEFAFIIDELLHAHPDESSSQMRYHKSILDTVISLGNGDEFIIALSKMIKCLAVDHLHIVGDIFDRGVHADSVMDLLMDYHSIDIEWGNHDILWMGASAGSEACIAYAVRNNLKHKNIGTLENGYGISLRTLGEFAKMKYPYIANPTKAMDKAIAIMLFKLEGQIIRRNPQFGMEDRLFLDKIDYLRRTFGRIWADIAVLPHYQWAYADQGNRGRKPDKSKRKSHSDRRRILQGLPKNDGHRRVYAYLQFSWDADKITYAVYQCGKGAG